MRHARFAAEAALVLAALLYGITFPLVHDALEDITPFAYLVGRFGIALLFVAPAAWIAARGLADRALLWRAGVIAGLLLFGGYATQTVGLQYTSPSTSAFITGLYVVLTPVVEAVVYRRVPGRAVWAGIVLATIGLYLLTGADVHLGRGELLTLACAVLFAGHIVYLGAYARRVPPAAFTGVQLGMVAVLSVPAAGAQGIGTITALAVFAVVFTGIACSAIALPLQLWGQRRIPPARAALILLAEPVFAGVADFITGERLGALRVTGAVVILVGIAVSELGSASARGHWCLGTRSWRDRSDAGRDRGVGAAHRVGAGDRDVAGRHAGRPGRGGAGRRRRRSTSCGGRAVHAWHADLWKSIAPVLHNLSVAAAAPSGIQIDADPESVLERLDEVYGAWQAEASLVAEAPIIRVLEARRPGPRGRSGRLTSASGFPTTPVETLDAAGIVTGEQRSRGRSVSPGPRASLVIRAPTREGLSGVAKERVERDEEDLVRLYLTDIGQYPLLTKDDEVRLAQQIEGGNAAREELVGGGKELTPTKKRELRRTSRQGDDAQRTFVQSNLRLVVSIAKKYQASGLPLLDLIQEGNLGLMHAVEKFDWRKGFKFSTYATWWIRQAITRGIANTGRTIRLPVHAGDTLARLQKARSRLELKLGRPATLSELSAEVEMPEDKVTEALRFAAEPLSLSEPLREDGDAELGDIVEDRSAESPFEVAATALLPDEIEKLLAPLDERERQILALRFGLDRGEPRTLEEVGEHFNLTRERIRQIEARAMSKLRHPSADTGARDLLAV